MDPRERIQDIRVFVAAALDGRQAEIWTALPAIVVSYNATLQTCQVQPTIGIQTINPVVSGAEPILVNMPLLVDCPVIFPHGGGFTLTFPIQPGDECLVILSSRCIDGWWGQGPSAYGQQQPQQGDLRMHDLSDGFVLVGPRSKPKVIGNVSTTTVQLRSDDGQAYVELTPGHVVNVVTPSDVNVNANGNVDVDAGGNVEIDAGGTAKVTAGGDITVTSSGNAKVIATGDVDVDATGNVSVIAGVGATVTAAGPITLASGVAITLTSIPGTITANGHVLG